MAAIREIFRKNRKGNPGLPKCKPCAVYIYEVLDNNGGKDKNEFGRKACFPSEVEVSGFVNY